MSLQPSLVSFPVTPVGSAAPGTPVPDLIRNASQAVGAAPASPLLERTLERARAYDQDQQDLRGLKRQAEEELSRTDEFATQPTPSTPAATSSQPQAADPGGTNVHAPFEALLMSKEQLENLAKDRTCRCSSTFATTSAS